MRSDVKRQRTNSSETPSSHSNAGSVREQSEQTEESRKKPPRGALVKNQRDKDIRDKDRLRVEAASKRNGRAERRRGDGNYSILTHWDPD